VLFSAKTQTWKIADFGLAQQGTSEAQITSRNARGKAGYRAPELVQEGVGKFSTKSDIWALGCILHEVITGAKPFPSDAAVYNYSLAEWPLPQHHPRSEFLHVFRIPGLLYVHPADRPAAKRLRLLNTLTRFLDEYHVSVEDRYIVYTSLQNAIVLGRLDILRVLIESNTVQGLIRNQEWPLSRSIHETKFRQADIVKELLKAGANSGDALLPLIARKEYSQIRKLFEAGETAGGSKVDEECALLAVAASDDLEAVMTIFISGCKMNSLSSQSLGWLLEKFWDCPDELGQKIVRVVLEATRLCATEIGQSKEFWTILYKEDRQDQQPSGVWQQYFVIAKKQPRRHLQVSKRTSIALRNLHLRPLCLSPDGKFLAAAAENALDIYEVGSGELTKSLLIPRLDSTCVVCFSPDNTHLVIGRPRDEIWLLEIATGWRRQFYDIEREDVSCIAICSADLDLFQIAFGDTRGIVTFFREDRPNEATTERIAPSDSTVTALAFFLEGKWIAARVSTGEMILVSTQQAGLRESTDRLGMFHKTIPLFEDSSEDPVSYLEALVSHDGTDVKVYNSAQLAGRVSNTDRIVCASGYAGEVRFYDTENGEMYFILRGEGFGRDFIGKSHLQYGS